MSAIYATQYARTQETAAPLAESKKIAVTTLAAEETDRLAGKIKSEHRGATLLIVGHSNTVPAIIARLGGGKVDPVAEDEFDNMYVLSLCGESARCVQLRYGNSARREIE